MCTGIVESASVSGSGKSAKSWFALDKVHVSYDHPFHAPFEHALNLDFVSKDGEEPQRVAVEMDEESAVRLLKAITKALARGGIEVSPYSENVAVTIPNERIRRIC